jgi:hypothetical protein
MLNGTKCNINIILLTCKKILSTFSEFLIIPTIIPNQISRKIDDNGGKASELGQTTVFGLQGILACWMRQSEVLEEFKQQQRPNHALHVFFDLDTGYEVLPVEEYGHLQARQMFLILKA